MDILKLGKSKSMLSVDSKLRVQEILKRVSSNYDVTLDERLYLQRLADIDQSVAKWLKKALRLQRNSQSVDPIETFLDELELGPPDPDSSFKPDQEDLGDWFKGAPSWITRS